MTNHYYDLRPLYLTCNLDKTAVSILGFGIYAPRWWRNFLHAHSFFELCYVYQGAGIFRHEGIVHRVKTADLFIARPNKQHEIIADEADPLGIYFWAFTLETSVDETTSLSALLKQLADRPAAKESLPNGRLANSLLPKTPAPQLEPTLQLIADELTNPRVGYRPALQGLFTKLMVDTVRIWEDPQAPTPDKAIFDPDAALINTITRFLHDNYPQRLWLRDVAAQVHLSERHVNRLFKQGTGQSVMAYLTQLRLEEAKRLLLQPNVLIGEVGTAVGFEDGRYFSTLFRQHTGLTPTAFRQQKGTQFLEQDRNES